MGGVVSWVSAWERGAHGFARKKDCKIAVPIRSTIGMRGLVRRIERKEMRQAGLGLLLLMMLGSCLSFGQSAQATSAAFYRTFMIQTAIERGTIFSIDVDNREYWITAKHLFTGVKTGPAGTYTARSATVSLLSQFGEGDQGHDQKWQQETFTVLDPGKDIDILVLVPRHALLPVGATLNPDTHGVGIGGDCEFLGFPYGGGWKGRDETAGWIWLPFVKHCTISGLNSENLKFWVLDGINNEGFSGGPVLYGTGPNQEVFAVVQGFHQEVLEVLPAQNPDGSPTGVVPPPPELPGGKRKQAEKQVVKTNSGFIIAFDIQPAIEVIRHNPIGPLRPAN